MTYVGMFLFSYKTCFCILNKINFEILLILRSTTTKPLSLSVSIKTRNHLQFDLHIVSRAKIHIYLIL